LSIQIAADPQLGAEAEALAREIARGQTLSHAIELSRAIAEAQIDLCRAREARRELWQRCVVDVDAPARGQVSLPSEDLGTKPTPGRSPAKDAQVKAQALADSSKKIHAIRRYESRAFARRKFAIRAFNSAVKKSKSVLE
jgi:hypothetical protein